MSNVPWAMDGSGAEAQGHHMSGFKVLVFSKPRVTQYLRCLTIVNMVTTLYDADLYRHVYNILYTVAVGYIILHYKVWPMQKKYTCGLEGTTKSRILHYKYLDLDPSSRSRIRLKNPFKNG